MNKASIPIKSPKIITNVIHTKVDASEEIALQKNPDTVHTSNTPGEQHVELAPLNRKKCTMPLHSESEDMQVPESNTDTATSGLRHREKPLAVDWRLAFVSTPAESIMNNVQCDDVKKSNKDAQDTNSDRSTRTSIAKANTGTAPTKTKQNSKKHGKKRSLKCSTHNASPTTTASSPCSTNGWWHTSRIDVETFMHGITVVFASILAALFIGKFITLFMKIDMENLLFSKQQ